MSAARRTIRSFYQALHDRYGPQGWWPAKSPFEVVVGAYLTQNTSWRNVERALDRLRRAGRLNAKGIRSLSLHNLGELIRPSGYFRQKSRALKIFVKYLDARYGGSLRRMFSRRRSKPSAWRELRQQLLGLRGVGEETADSILLYAGNLPVFVVDAYTRRVFGRHKISSNEAPYDEIQRLVEESFAPPRFARGTLSGADSAQQLNEMHALLVQVGKDYCFKRRPNCQDCPLRRFLPSQRSREVTRSRQR